MVHRNLSQVEFIRPKKSTLSLDMAPLIDCVFQLLIFFMLTSSFATPALKLNLPQAIQHDKKEMDRVIVSIDKTGSLFINTQKIAMDSLKTELATHLSKSEKKAILFQGDENIPYHQFVEVMDTARQVGAKQINIAHNSKKT